MATLLICNYLVLKLLQLGIVLSNLSPSLIQQRCCSEKAFSNDARQCHAEAWEASMLQCSTALQGTQCPALQWEPWHASARKQIMPATSQHSCYHLWLPHLRLLLHYTPTVYWLSSPELSTLSQYPQRQQLTASPVCLGAMGTSAPCTAAAA